MERQWAIMDRFGMTATLYADTVADAEWLDDAELFAGGDGLHWQWWVTREMNHQLLLQLQATLQLHM